MRLFTHSDGFIFSFGFNMQERKPDLYYIGWCDPQTLDWDCTNDSTYHHQAGWIRTPFIVAPQFIHELRGSIVAYQTDMMIVLTQASHPFVWQYTRYIPEEFQGLRVA